MNQIEDKRKIRQISSIGQIFAPEITRTISYIYARAPRVSIRHHRRAEKLTPCRCTEKKRRRNEFRAPNN